MPKFKLNNNAGANMTSLKGHVTLCYADIVATFGDPIPGDGEKVSGEWHFTDEIGNVFTLYDWKWTELYSPNLPSVESFRARPEAEFNVGGRIDASEFITWLKGMILTGDERQVLDELSNINWLDGYPKNNLQKMRQIAINQIHELEQMVDEINEMLGDEK